MKKQNLLKKSITCLAAGALIAANIGFQISPYVSAAGVQENGFDENSVVLRFGVLSDIHLSGSWNVETSRAKLDKAYKSLLALAGSGSDGQTLLDAVFIDGDIVDAMNSSGNVSGDANLPKLLQNYKEISAFRDITIDNFGGSDIAVIYANGNHDTTGGIALDESNKPDTSGFYSSKLYQKILSGYKWSDTVPGTENPTIQQKVNYNKEQIEAYDEKNGENYEFFYGRDEYLGENGLDYGNRNVTVGGYHFLTIEPKAYPSEFSAETLSWLDETLAAITLAEPDKAVFVATHPRINNTVFASSGGASADVTDILNKYPQVIIWGGHEHSALNRELAIWQGGFTAVDAGVVQYISAQHLSYDGGKNPVNGKNFGGYSGSEYRNSSQGQYVEVDKQGNVRIKRIDFYNSDVGKGDIKIIGEPWDIVGISSDGSHLGKYTKEERAACNIGPTFGEGAAISAETNGNTVKISFPAARDDVRIISYFVTVENSGNQVNNIELTSFYYDHADASELDSEIYTYEITDMPGGISDIKVTAVDDFGASAELSAQVEFEETAAVYPSSEYNINNINQGGYSSGCEGMMSTGVSFESRNGVVSIGKAENNLNGEYAIIMNNYSKFPEAALNETPYMVIDYYYSHNNESAKSAADKMRWRFFVGQSKAQVTKEAALETNKWATVVIPLTDSKFADDGYKITQFKFDPFGTTAVKNLDDSDKLYISGIRFVHEIPTVYTENGISYVSADKYIEGVGAKIHVTLAEAIAALGSNGGTVYAEGDIVADAPAAIEAAGNARKAVNVVGYGDVLEKQQQNRVWFQKTVTLREVGYNGDITFDRITLKAPYDEAGLFAKNVKLVMGKDIIMEKTVKGNTDINASGTKDMTFNFGGVADQSGKNRIDVYGGTYGEVAALYQWQNTTATNVGINSETHYRFFGGDFSRVLAGVRNSSTAVLNVNGNVTYDFYGGKFSEVYTGSYKHGKINGTVVYNIYGGNFKNGIGFGNFYNASGNSISGNTAVIINSKSEYEIAADGGLVIKNSANELVKNDGAKWIAVINNAELEKASFEQGLNTDYKISVYGGSAQPVFEDKTLAGFRITCDDGDFTPVVNGNLIFTNENGLYDLSLYEGTAADIWFDEIGIDISYIEDDTSAQNEKFNVRGAQLRIPTAENGNIKQGLRFIARMGKNIADNEKIIKPQNSSDKDIGYGFTVLPSDILGNSELLKETLKAAVVPAVVTFSETDDYIEYTVCITGIQKEVYKRMFTVRPYITYTDGFGYIRTIYGESYEASIYGVAEMAVSAGDHAEWVQKNIIDIADSVG